MTQSMPTSPTERAKDAALAYANLIAYSRATTRWCRRGSFEEEGGVLSFAGGSWVPVNCNGAFRTDDSVSASAFIARANAFFARHGRGYTIKVRDTGQDDDVAEVAAGLGFAPFGDPFPEMICHAPFPSVTAPEGIELRPVTTVGGVLDFQSVNADAYATYGMPTDVLPDSFDEPERLLDDDDVSVIVAYSGDQPLATALTYLSHGIASLQWVGTAEASRRLGLGRVITQAITNVAFEHAARPPSPSRRRRWASRSTQGSATRSSTATRTTACGKSATSEPRTGAGPHHSVTGAPPASAER